MQGLRVGVRLSLSNIEHKSDLRGNGLKKLILHENVNTNDNDTAAALLLLQMLVSGIILAGRPL